MPCPKLRFERNDNPNHGGYDLEENGFSCALGGAVASSGDAIAAAGL
jgi:hypothetical protein